MTHAQEADLLKSLDKLMMAMNHPTKRNQIKDERLKYYIGLLLASEHSYYWIKEGMDEVTEEDFTDAANRIAEAFELINDVAVEANIRVMEEVVEK